MAWDIIGTVTAANSSKLSDGASAMLVMSAERSKSLGLKPLARILGFADAEQDPKEFPTSPTLAIPEALKMADVHIDQVDRFEINEAFAVVAIVNRNVGFEPMVLPHSRKWMNLNWYDVCFPLLLIFSF
jgi:acetyl-CoA C-acetyltransferase